VSAQPQDAAKTAATTGPRPVAAVPQMTLTIDGVEVTCDRGETILQAAERAGVQIPTLCYESRLPASAACRLCMVEVEGWGKPVSSCSTYAADGIVVHTDTEKVRKMRRLYLELLLSDHNSFCTPPCADACPTHIKIPQFLDAIARGDYATGVRKLREDLPFPAILGRVCPRPCEEPCRRNLVDEPITICSLHRFVADQCLDDEQTGELLLPYEPRPDSGKRVAVLGAGPAGLACAFYACLDGHRVTIFEAEDKPGGLLRYGIPGFRLPREVVDKELNVLWRLGVELECGKRLGADLRLDDLTAAYDAVFLGLGARQTPALAVEGAGAAVVTDALELLADLERGADLAVARKVAVVGDGFAAAEACRVARRRGATQVTWLSPCARADMTAPPTEIAAALDEGVRLEEGVTPVALKTGARGALKGIELRRAGGDDTFVLACGQVVNAGGHVPLLDGTTEAQGVARTAAGTIRVNEDTLQADEPRIFAGGDVVLGARTAIEAVAQGKRAAWSIDAFLRGRDMAALARELADVRATAFPAALAARERLDPAVARLASVKPVFIDMTVDVSHPAPRPRMPELTVAERVTGFAEVELGLAEEQAREGAALCLDCHCPANGDCELQRYGIEYEVFANRFHGQATHDYPADLRHDFIMREPNRCIMCLRCVRVCRLEVGASCYDAMGRGWDTIVSTPDNLPLQTVGCISCGKCAETCPTGSIEINRRELQSYDLDESRCIFCGECVEVCPYDALEQTAFFELAGYSRTRLAGASLFVRGPRQTDGPRTTVPDVEPHVRDAVEGRGWQWAPLKGDGGLDELERDL
jgi:formate dehydrogenase major subunit